ncbi:MAG: bifunctional UDP-N-acetylglucosamine diphosphorylase/glucosamine-1-phosphate N-acetyltransferase GlmU [Thiotrichaceae bacterium]|nr:bifunctional UDP-N-acetylglucosamine diphosphorylase/glucosamine-1-phosphate N-acetyltransferase GlmU [Thiotrichaceae bacterium]
MRILPIILAAGQGTRMRSSLPKVLHPIAGKPMLEHVVEACCQLNNEKIVIIYGHGGEQVQEAITYPIVDWVLQKEQKGTGHAVVQAFDMIKDDDCVVIAYGDVPLIKAHTLQQLVTALDEATDLVVLTTILANPTNYGRILRDVNGKVLGNVEEKDADDQQCLINEVNTGFMAARGKALKSWLQQLDPNNAQNEYYLTDCIAMAASTGSVNAVVCTDINEVQGVNDRIQQAQLERVYQQEQAFNLMRSGASLADPSRIDVRGELTVGQDVKIDVNAVFTGKVTLGDRVSIAAGCVISDSDIADDAIIKPHSVIESAVVGKHCQVGPFARLRPEAVLCDYAKVGNYVEVKKSTIGLHSKVSHLSYIGDTVMGDHVNIGAGTITCNYDGKNKHQTVIGDDVFVGSSTQLVAPVVVKKGATIGAGSTIRKEAPADKLTLTRNKQITINGWERPIKKS